MNRRVYGYCMTRAIGRQPEVMQRRYLQALVNIAGDKISTTVIPEPIDPVAPLLGALKKHGVRATMTQSIC